jgi:arsenite-transporting ATPase
MSLNLMECAQSYIAKKLKSKTIAHWIIKTPFFNSLISMIPGFSYVIYLGQILEFLLENPQRIIVLDSPSSGHALTMLESTKNFNEIFQDGVIYQDTHLMLSTMKSPHFTKINIITIPTQLAINEALELKEKIQQLESYDVDIYCNHSLSDFEIEDLPIALKKKIHNEQLAISDYTEQIHSKIKYSTKNDTLEIIKDLVPSLENLV